MFRKKLVLAIRVLLTSMAGLLAFNLEGANAPRVIIGEKAENYTCEYWAKYTVADTVLNNNIWGVSRKEKGRQCISSSNDGTHYGWGWEWKNFSNHIITYPSITFGHKPWEAESTTDVLPRPVVDLQKIEVSFHFDEYSKGSNNLLLESWLTEPGVSGKEGIRREVGIHFFQKGWLGQAGRKIGKETIDGIKYDIYYTKPWETERAEYTWEYVSFVRRTKFATPQTVTVDFKKFYEVLKNYNLSNDDFMLSSIELGTEVIRGYGNVLVRDLAFDIVEN